MKTKIRSLLVIAVSVFASCNIAAQIQSPFTVHNLLNCDIVINITVKSLLPTPCTSCSGNAWVALKPGDMFQYTIPAGCQPACDMEVWMLHINGNATFCNSYVNSSQQHKICGCNEPCCTNPHFGMHWTSGSVIIQ